MLPWWRSWYIDSDSVTCRPHRATYSLISSSEGPGCADTYSCMFIKCVRNLVTWFWNTEWKKTAVKFSSSFRWLHQYNIIASHFVFVVCSSWYNQIILQDSVQQFLVIADSYFRLVLMRVHSTSRKSYVDTVDHWLLTQQFFSHICFSLWCSYQNVCPIWCFSANWSLNCKDQLLPSIQHFFSFGIFL